MLNYCFLKLRWINYIKNNFYLDFGLKFVIRAFVYKIYINLAYFFAEKYIIEYGTRYVFNYASSMFYKKAFNLNGVKLTTYSLLFIVNVVFVLI